MAVQCPHHADARQHQPSAADFRGAEQMLDRGLPSSSCCSAFGSFVM
jgi:hypothetical protein